MEIDVLYLMTDLSGIVSNVLGEVVVVFLIQVKYMFDMHAGVYGSVYYPCLFVLDVLFLFL